MDLNEKLEKLKSKIMLDESVTCHKNGYGELDSTFACLHSFVERVEDYPNKNYIGLSRSVILCVDLYESAPDAYAHLFSDVFAENEVFLDTLPGAMRLMNFFNWLSDDHDYGFDTKKGQIVYQRGGNMDVRGLCPKYFLEIVEGVCQNHVQSVSLSDNKKMRVK